MKKALLVLLSLAMVLASLSLAVAEEPVYDKTLNVFYASGHTASVHTDKIRAWIEEQLGCNYNLIQGDGANFNQQLALYAAGGDMPDIVWCSYDTWYEYALEGAWADISGYMEQYPALQNYLKDQSLWAFMAIDGEGIYGVPNSINLDSNAAMFIRKDWLDKLGMEMPTTLEEYTAVIKAFTHNDPDGDGQNNTYGLIPAGYKYLSPFFGAFGAVADEHYFLNDDGATVTTNAISENYKAGLKYLHELYADGCIDPSVWDEPGFGPDSWVRGEAGIYSSAWSWAAMCYAKKDFGTLNPTAIVENAVMPIGTDGKNGNVFQGAFTTVVAVSAFCDDEIRDYAVKMLNLAATDLGFWTTFMGVQGEYWDYDENGNIAWSWQTNGGFLADGSAIDVTTVEMYKLLYHELEQAGAIYPLSYANTGSEKDRLLLAGDNARKTNNCYKNLFAYLHCDEYSEYATTLTDYFHQSMIAFIKGEKDIDADWDEYVSTYLSMGGEEVRTALLALYNELYGTNYTFAD